MDVGISSATDVSGTEFQPVERRGRGRAHERYLSSRFDRPRGQNHGIQPVPGTRWSPRGDADSRTNVEPGERGPQQPGQGQSSSHPVSRASPFARPIISQQQQPAVLPRQPAFPLDQDQRPQVTDWMDQLARGMSELVVQPVSSSQQDRGWMNQLGYGMNELAVQRQEHGARPPQRPVSTTHETPDWMNQLAHGMSELVVQQQQQTSWLPRQPLPAPTAAVAAPGRRGGLEPGYWGSGPSLSSNNHIPAPSTAAISPAPLLSLNQLAEDASIQLELFSQGTHDNDVISDEHQTMITSASTSIEVIQARCTGSNRNVTSREEINRDADCIICYAERADKLFMPCKHLVVCTVRTPPDICERRSSALTGCCRCVAPGWGSGNEIWGRCWFGALCAELELRRLWVFEFLGDGDAIADGVVEVVDQGFSKLMKSNGAAVNRQ